MNHLNLHKKKLRIKAKNETYKVIDKDGMRRTYQWEVPEEILLLKFFQASCHMSLNCKTQKIYVILLAYKSINYKWHKTILL
jgi:hypothetical protein